MLFPYFLDSSPVEISGRVQLLDNGDLLIAAVKSNDVGKYTCIRANEAGSVNGSAYLSVLGNFFSFSFLCVSLYLHSFSK